jgi:VCBS repeat protein
MSAPSTFDTGTGPGSVAVGDFNGDGKFDLVVGNVFSNTVRVLLGEGNGTFQAAVDYGTGISPSAVEVGDFNEDGR